jgi:hypothetical protein
MNNFQKGISPIFLTCLQDLFSVMESKTPHYYHFVVPLGTRRKEGGLPFLGDGGSFSGDDIWFLDGGKWFSNSRKPFFRVDI